MTLLVTPQANLAVNGGSQHPLKRRAGGHGPTLADQIEYLPTPTASLVNEPAPWKPGVQWWLQSRAARSLAAIETLLPAPQLLPAGMVVDWGPYARAILRWEKVLGRMVPHPLEPGRGGRGRLNPEFVEWMQGLPEGWVTSVDISRNAQLKALGNGVVPQQAMLGIMVLLARLGLA